MHENFLDNYLRRYGRLADVEEVASDEALTVTLDNGDLRVEDAYVGLISMGEEERKQFIGKKVGYKTEIDINEMYKTPAQRASMLHVKEDELKDINPKFSLEITKIRRFTNPELNDEFFKTAFPEGEVKNAKELDAIHRCPNRQGDFARERLHVRCDDPQLYGSTRRNSPCRRDSSNAGSTPSTRASSRWRTSRRTSTHS